MSRATFTTALTWFYKGIGLGVPENVTEIDLEAVHPVLDAFQGGWAIGEYKTLQHTVAATSYPVDTAHVVIPESNDLFRLILSCDLFSGAVLAQTLTVFKRREMGGTVYIALGKVAGIAANDTVPWSTLAQGAPYWFLEPRSALILYNNTALAVGDSVRLRVSYLEMPKGFKPI